MRNLLVLFFAVFINGCGSSVDVRDWKSNPEYRSYISTRVAEAVLEYDILTDETIDTIDVEGCDGSGWIVHGDGHKTPCPGCDSCEKEVTEETIEEINLPPETKPKTINQTKTKIKRPLSKIFNRKRR